ncbi:MAG: hypothetical protein ACI4XM_02095 [Candidatus Coprovivens sp.]
MKKNKKYDIIIYSCLVGAFIFILLGYWDNLKDLKEDGLSFSLKNQETEENSSTEQKEYDLEPKELVNADKNGIIKKYLDSLLDRIDVDPLISYNMINTWEEYEILNIEYDRKIAENYYAYIVDIKISNKDAVIPTNKNEKISTNEYIVITLNVNIAYSELKNGFIVKKIDKPVEN